MRQWDWAGDSLAAFMRPVPWIKDGILSNNCYHNEIDNIRGIKAPRKSLRIVKLFYGV